MTSRETPKPELESEDLVGTVVDGRYEVMSLLSEGGMGQLYDVVHVALGQRAVLKTILPKFARDPRIVERFLREARAASRIGNPHIVDIRDSGTLRDGRAYYVMEFLEGHDVRDLLDERVVVEEEHVVEIACQVLSALEAAHGEGLVHRDLKPENIFLTRGADGSTVAKVVDFGLVRFTEVSAKNALTRAGELVGTPHYMSPEQCMGAPVDIRSDLYSLGLVMYEMVSGEVPYEQEEILQIVLRKTVDEYPPFGPLEKLASPELRSILRRCLVADLDSRFPTPRAMLESLEALRASYSQSSPAPRLVPDTLYLEVAQLLDPAPGEGCTPTLANAAPVRRRSSAAGLRERRGLVRGLAAAGVTFAMGAAAIAALVFTLSPARAVPPVAPVEPSSPAITAGPTVQPAASTADVSPATASPATVPSAAVPSAAVPLPQGVEVPVAPTPVASAPVATSPHPEPLGRRAPRVQPASRPSPRPLAAAEPAPVPEVHAEADVHQAHAIDSSGLFNPWD